MPDNRGSVPGGAETVVSSTASSYGPGRAESHIRRAVAALVPNLQRLGLRACQSNVTNAEYEKRWMRTSTSPRDLTADSFTFVC
jgi:hypothetical protein